MPEGQDTVLWQIILYLMMSGELIEATFGELQ